MPPPPDDHPPDDPPPGERPGGEQPRGVIDQLRRVARAVRHLAEAHLGLARAELGAIAEDATQVGLALGLVAACLVFVALLVPVGLTLFVGEWLFGSLGWGVLLGTEFALALAVVLVLDALEIPRSTLARRLGSALVLGLVVAVLLGLAATNYAWAAVGEVILPGVTRSDRPLATAALVGVVGGGLLGLLVAAARARVNRTLALVGGLAGGALAGLALGAFTAISFTPEIGVAIGIALALLVWPGLSALELRGYDWGALKARFYPSITIKTAQETLEWLHGIQERTLPGRKS